MTSSTETLETDAWSRFLDTREESAFAEVVARHIHLVYSVALRRSGGDEALAEDVAQTVFSDLARKAAGLPRNLVLAGWLYRHSTFVASTLVRTEARRRRREQAALAFQVPGESIDWSTIAPVLDDALNDLPERDRNAIVLRFLDQQPFAVVGRSLGIGPDAARMRVDRALGRLRALLAQRGVASTAAALALGISQHCVMSAPPALAASVAAASTLSTLTLAPTAFLGLMSTTKISLCVAAVVATAASTVAYLEHRTNETLQAEIAALHADSALREAGAATSSTLSSAELDALRQDRVRLMALRDEVGRLREAQRRVSTLEQENQALRRDQTSRQQGSGDSGDKEPRDFQAELQQGLALARMNFTRSWTIAFLQFAGEHGGRIPDSFAEAAAFYPKENGVDTSVLDPNRFEIIYRGSLNQIPNPSSTILIREREAFEAKRPDGTTALMRTYAFADGHSEIHTAPDGNFEEWERGRIQVQAESP